MTIERESAYNTGILEHSSLDWQFYLEMTLLVLA